jgi:hypothetical protein
MTEMIEKVARAMAENAGFCWDNCAQSQWMSDARAGIAAMREPTGMMLTASVPARKPNNSPMRNSRMTWYAMIDSALHDVPVYAD